MASTAAPARVALILFDSGSYDFVEQKQVCEQYPEVERRVEVVDQFGRDDVLDRDQPHRGSSPACIR